MVIWLVFQIVLWTAFAVTYSLSPGAYDVQARTGHEVAQGDGLLKTILVITGHNSMLLFLIALGNLFVRFGAATPGLLILLMQGVIIGKVAGANSFEFRFESIAAANVRYLKVGLWETTAYALVCAVTLTKSLYVAKEFPAKQWSHVRKLREIKYDGAEKALLVAAVLMLMVSAYVEVVLLAGP